MRVSRRLIEEAIAFASEDIKECRLDGAQDSFAAGYATGEKRVLQRVLDGEFSEKSETA